MPARVVQVHLSRRCNLRCRHCYSFSGPDQRDELDTGDVLAFLAMARREGYDTVSFSGGEPFVHRGMAPTVAGARDMGLRCIAVSNGSPLAAADPELLRSLDLIAISVDGPREVHDAMRASPVAFDMMRRGLAVLRDRGIGFGIAHTLTRDSLPHLAWLADFAVAEGAALLQIHPLGLVGAAQDSFAEALDGEFLARAYLAALALRHEVGERLHIHVDLFNRYDIVAMPDLVVPSWPDGGRLGDAIETLVLMANGDVAPICHDIAPPFRLGNLRNALSVDALRTYRANGFERLRAFCSELRAELIAQDGWPYLNWFELLERRSQSAALEPAIG